MVRKSIQQKVELFYILMKDIMPYDCERGFLKLLLYKTNLKGFRNGNDILSS